MKIRSIGPHKWVSALQGLRGSVILNDSRRLQYAANRRRMATCSILLWDTDPAAVGISSGHNTLLVWVNTYDNPAEIVIMTDETDADFRSSVMPALEAHITIRSDFERELRPILEEWAFGVSAQARRTTIRSEGDRIAFLLGQPSWPTGANIASQKLMNDAHREAVAALTAFLGRHAHTSDVPRFA
jgi:hypothetical protein